MLAEIEAADVGKSTHDAEMAIGGVAGEGEHWCLYATTLDEGQDVSVGPTAAGDTLPLDVVYRRDPIGVVGLISAWNYPLNVAFRKVAPALIAGNSVVLKPSELGGLSVMYLAQLAVDAGIPNGVFNVVMGERDAGQALAEHKDVGMISFTGYGARFSTEIYTRGCHWFSRLLA
jgi:acyl-CoA reductase-like NAD-dependent aldehyde dehydrogenase